jgi:hypothetical protein
MGTWRVRIESAYAVVLDGQAEKANRELGGWLLRGARARKRSTEDRVDIVVLVLVMEKEGQSDIERAIFDSVLTAQLYSLYSKISSAYMTLACCI